MKRESFIIYRSFYEPIKDLSNDEIGILFHSICDYALNGTSPINLSQTLQMAFSFICTTIDRDNIKYQNIIARNKGNIGKRWNKEITKNTTGKSGKIRYSDNDTDNDTVNDTDNKKGKKKTSVFIPPSLQEVIVFFKSKGSDEQTAKNAFDHYDAGDWNDTHGEPVRSWKQKMLTNWINNSRSNLPSGKQIPPESQPFKQLER